MNLLYIFTVPGEPRGKARARSFAKLTKSGKVISGNYTPEKTRNNEAFIKERFLAEFPGYEPITGYVSLHIDAFFSIPKSTSKKDRALMFTAVKRPTKKPDIKNIQASVEDALNTIAYKDDSQIVSVRADKWYSDRPPGLLIKIEEIRPFI